MEIRVLKMSWTGKVERGRERRGEKKKKRTKNAIGKITQRPGLIVS